MRFAETQEYRKNLEHRSYILWYCLTTFTKVAYHLACTFISYKGLISVKFENDACNALWTYIELIYVHGQAYHAKLEKIKGTFSYSIISFL